MAVTFKGYRVRLAYLMSGSDTKADAWFDRATFAKASTGHYMAWRPDDLSNVAVLPPDHPRGEPCRWLTRMADDADVDSAIRYVESGEFDEAGRDGVLNLFLEEDRWIEL